jgi:signal transduction histidine kinase
MVPSLLVAALVSRRLQTTLTDPILGVARVARDVLTRRDFHLRARKTSDDEVGTLVDAFNNMLEEVGKRTEALEQSNNHLSVEMAERRRAEEALRAAARTKDQFLATLAHELRNPLAPITNAVEILRRGGAAQGQPQQRALEIMSRQVQQMVRLIDDLFDLSRITTGKVLLDMSRVDLVAVLGSAVEIASPGIAARGHQLALHLPDGPAFVHGDAARLAQVFANLLNNASKYTDEGGRISMRLEEGADDCVIRVDDTGVGIAPDKQASIFDMFVQVDEPTSRGPKSGSASASPSRGSSSSCTAAASPCTARGWAMDRSSSCVCGAASFRRRSRSRRRPSPRPCRGIACWWPTTTSTSPTACCRSWSRSASR